MNEIVKVYTDLLGVNGMGDFVRCSDCGELMLTQIGATVCGECGSENLEWVNEACQECSMGCLESFGYILVEI